ncbi:MAG: hypothetical protein WC011_02905 [Candidatus Paceibacterota bacterium]
MLTDQDIQKLASIFLTKKDLENLATKEDLKSFATKEDLKSFATKEDLLDIKNDIGGLKGDMAGVKNDIVDIKSDLGSLTQLVETVAISVSKLTDKVDGLETNLNLFKLETNTHFNNLETDLKSFKIETRENFKELNEKFDDMSDTVNNHDRRIEILEEKVLS